MTADEIAEVLELEPWLEWYCDPDDPDVHNARARFHVVQKIALEELARSGHPVAIRHTRNEMLTTSYTHDTELVEVDVEVRSEARAMSTGNGLSQVAVEEDGAILRGVAVPFRRQAVVLGPGKRGAGLVAHKETFDAESILGVGALAGTPFLIGHDVNRPHGAIQSSRSTDRGLEVEVRLMGSDSELQSFRRRAEGGVLSGLSIGFVPSRKRDIWLPPDETGLPTVLRRGARLRELSAVVFPAFEDARVVGITVRTAAAVERHQASQRAIAEIQATLAEVAPILARRRR
jgi:HK97 family phage prohead protease